MSLTNPAASPPPSAEKSLSTTVLKGGSWLGLSALAQALLQIVIFAVLARLLTPTQFGLVAIASIFIDLATGIAPLGTGQALVQRRDLTDDHIRASVWISIVTGLLTAVLLVAASGPIAELLGSPDSAPLIAALAALFPLRALSFVPAGLAARVKNFRALALRQLAAYIVGYGVVGIACAWIGVGPWSLVYAQLTQALVATVLLVAVVRFPMRPTLSAKSYREILSYGSGFSAARVLNSLANQIDRAVVSSYTNPAAIGLYTRSLQIVRYPTLLVGQVIEDVLFPSFSGVQTDLNRLRGAFGRSVGAIFVTMTPLSVFVAVASQQICDVLLGPQWDGVVPLIIVFGTSIAFRSAQRICASALRALGHSWAVAAVQGLLLAMTVVGSFIGIRFGLVGAAIAVTVSYISHYIVLTILTVRTLNCNGWQVLVQHFAGLPLAVLTGLAATSIPLLDQVIPSFAALAAGSLLTVVLVGALALLWPRGVLGADGVWLFSIMSAKLPNRLFKVPGLRAAVDRLSS